MPTCTFRRSRRGTSRPYRRQEQVFGRIIREYGALDYREFIGDDLFPKGMVSFTKRVKLLPGEVLIAAIAGFRSRAHRDQVLKKMFNDQRMAAKRPQPIERNCR